MLKLSRVGERVSFEELEIYKAMEDLLEENSYRGYILIPEKDYEGKIDNLIDMYKDAYDECLIYRFLFMGYMVMYT